MATLISANGGGNWTTLATWRNACTGTGAIQTTASYEANTGTSYSWSVSFTVTNGEVIEGVALLLYRYGSTGTFTVALSEDGGTPTREVTVNTSDLPSSLSWVFFKFGSTLIADGGSDYKVGVKNSVGGSSAGVYRSPTNVDYCRILREDSAPGSLSAGDVFYVMDDLTGAGAKTANTVTMDCLASAVTDFGAVTVGFGTLTYGATAATNYYLKVSGDLIVWGGGILNIGTTGTKMPADSTAVLELDPTSDGEFGLLIKDGGTLVAQGNPMTKVWTLLNANAAVNATSLTTADSTGWKDNDQIAIASTTRTYTQCEVGTLNGDASGTTLTVDGFGGTGGGLAYAHDGSATGGPASGDIRAEIINLTRNVKIRSSSSTIMTYVSVAAAATVDFDYVEIYYVGENATGKRGVEIATTTGSCSMQYCSIHDTEDWGVTVNCTGAITFSWNVAWNLNTAAVSGCHGAYFSVSSSASIIQNNVFLYINLISAGVFGVYLATLSPTATISYNRVAGSKFIGFQVNFNSCNLSNLMAHSCGSHGIVVGSTGNIQQLASSFASWRNSGTGLVSSGYGIMTITSLVAFGNTTYNLSLGNAFAKIVGAVLNAEASYPTTYGLVGTIGKTVVSDSFIGNSVAHSAGIYIGDASNCQIYTSHCTIQASSPFSMSSGNPFWIAGIFNSYTTGTNQNSVFYPHGSILSEASVRHTASGLAWKLSAVSAARKLVFPGPVTFDTFKAAVIASAAVTITAWVRKDSSYNGNAPRLVLVGGYIGGIAADVTDSLSVGADTWEQLSVSGTPNEAGVIEWYVDCDGTAGSVYVDDMAVSQSGLPSADNLDYVSWGLPLMAPYTLGGGGGSTVIVVED